jgi:hypothetical protein
VNPSFTGDHRIVITVDVTAETMAQVMRNWELEANKFQPFDLWVATRLAAPPSEWCKCDRAVLDIGWPGESPCHQCGLPVEKKVG